MRVLSPSSSPHPPSHRKMKEKDRRKTPKIYTTHSSHERFVFSSRSRTARLSFQCLCSNDQQIVKTKRRRWGTHSWTVTMCCSKDHLKNPLSLCTRVCLRQFERGSLPKSTPKSLDTHSIPSGCRVQ